jgi:hypothetical protein
MRSTRRRRRVCNRTCTCNHICNHTHPSTRQRRRTCACASSALHCRGETLSGPYAGGGHFSVCSGVVLETVDDTLVGVGLKYRLFYQVTHCQRRELTS